MSQPNANNTLYVIPDAASFFTMDVQDELDKNDWDDPPWNLALIEEMLQFWSPEQTQPDYPLLLVGAPHIFYDEMFSMSFDEQWQCFVAGRRETCQRQVNYAVRKVTTDVSETQLLEPVILGAPLMEVHFLCAEMFSIDKPWLEILRDTGLGLDLTSGWKPCHEVHPEMTGCDLDAHLRRQPPGVQPRRICPVGSITTLKRIEGERVRQICHLLDSTKVANHAG